jgi:hypothetical protein
MRKVGVGVIVEVGAWEMVVLSLGRVVGGVEVSSTLAIDQVSLLWGDCEEARKSQQACAAA